MKNNLHNIQIRRAKLDDLPEIHQLFIDTIKHTCSADYDPIQINAWTSSVEDKHRWENFINSQYFIVAEIFDKIVGFASLENGNYLDFMYVHKDYQRKGIANSLYQDLEKKALKQGHSKMTAYVSKTALPFFKEKGFKMIRENKNLIQNVEIINYYMSQ